MATETETLNYSVFLKAPPVELYRAFTNSTALREWLCDTATVAARPDGHLYLGWNDGYYAAGHYTELKDNQLVVFTWLGRGDPEPTQVKVMLAPQGDGTSLTLEHSGMGRDAEWVDKTAAFDRGWKIGLENLESVLTTGMDLRITRRPMLGILLDSFEAEDAARLGVPVTAGVRLSGVISGLGAEAAGLRGDDVIVRINDQDVADLPALQRNLAASHAGDTVEVAYYRGPERQVAHMVLSGRPIPALPATAPEFAARVRSQFDRDLTTLRDFLRGITEDEASFNPGPEEWNVKQVLAHIIQGERFYHQWIAELTSGFEAAYDGFSGNRDVIVNATIEAYPTVSELMTQLDRVYTETVALLANLPDEFISARRTYWRLSLALLTDSYSHVNDHLDQMRESVRMARDRSAKE